MNGPSPELPAIPEVELRAWRQFLALAETLHFGRAAARLGMTQPPLTQAVQKLEARLGVMLFQRTRRSVALAPGGAALVEPVRALLGAAAGLPDLAQRAAAGQLGALRLGFVSTVGFGPLPGWLRSYHDENPGVRLRLREATGDVQLAALARRELDAGFVVHAPGVSPASDATMRRLPVGSEPLVVALPSSGTGRGRRPEISDLLSRPLVVFPRESAPSLFDALLAFYHRHGVAPAIAQEAIQMQTIVNLVSAGMGIALVPRSVSRLRRPGVVYRPIPRALAGAPRVETSLVWPPDAPPAAARFVEHVRARLGRSP